jgi:hypothetical protein
MATSKAAAMAADVAMKTVVVASVGLTLALVVNTVQQARDLTSKRLARKQEQPRP